MTPPATHSLAKPYTIEDIAQELRAFENRFGMSTSSFLARWRAGELDEAEFDFIRWEAAAEEHEEMAAEAR